MEKRTKSLQRVLAVQQQVVRLAEWRHGLLKRQCAEIKEDQRRLHDFTSGEPLSPLLSAAAFVRGQTLIKDSAEREGQQTAQAAHTDAMRRREKLAERLVETLRERDARAAEKRMLEETIEAFRLRDDASFP